MSNYRVIALVDMDCFYVQVEQRANPNLKGKPCVVVQYNEWRGGGIIAVSYEARAKGVKRGPGMRGDDAKELCPDLEIAHVPEVRGKANLTRYRTAAAEVIAVFCKFSDCVERASVDEAYIDLTEQVDRKLAEQGNTTEVTPEDLLNTHVEGWHSDGADDSRSEGVKSWLSTIESSSPKADSEHDEDEATFSSGQSSYMYALRLAVGAKIVEEIRAAVYEETDFRCSAGISHNKVLAKLACGLHKPNQQTVLLDSSVEKLFETMPLNKVRHLGGKLGDTLVSGDGLQFMGDLRKFSMQELQTRHGDKTGSWLFELCRGIEHEPVLARQLPKSIGCGKNFPGKQALNTKEKVKKWLALLSEEMEERLLTDREDNKRDAKTLTVYVRTETGSMSRCCPLTKYDKARICQDCFLLAEKYNTAPPDQKTWSPPITSLSVCAGKFVDSTNTNKISNFFSPSTSDSVHQEAMNCTVTVRGETPKTNGSNTTGKDKMVKGFFARKMLQMEQQTMAARDEPMCGDVPNSSNNYSEALEQSNECSENEVNTNMSNGRRTTKRRNIVICDKCSKPILDEDVLQHKDYHFALELQRQQRTVISNYKPQTPAATAGNKRKLAIPGKHGGKKKQKTTPTLDTFFKKK